MSEASQDRYGPDLRDRSSAILVTSARRLLGAVVRAVQDDRTAGGAVGHDLRRPLEPRQDRHRRQSADAQPVPRPRHPNADVFKDGKPVATQVGAVSKAQLDAFIEANL